MARRSGLGRGLGALIPPEGTAATAGSALRDVGIGDIRPNRNQPRRHFDEEELLSLVASIRELGVLQPVLVRPTDDGTYELIAGERRWRAAKRAGLATVPAIVRGADDVASLEQAVVENSHRQDLNPLEEAAAYQQLLEDFSFTHDQLAVRMGKSRTAITNALRLFQLPPSIQRLVAEGRLSAGHARALLATPDRQFQEQLAARVVAEQLSVRATEDEVRSHGEVEAPNVPKAAAARERPAPTDAADGPALGPVPALRHPGLHELELLLSEHLSTRVRVEDRGKHGQIVVEFADLSDLERIYRAMTDGSKRAEVLPST